MNMERSLFATLSNQDLMDFIRESVNEWNRRYEDQEFKKSQEAVPTILKFPLKQAYLTFGSEEKSIN
jgi:hypothetical protein